MKKIHFGYSNDNNPTGSFEGMGASRNKDIIDSEFIDFMELNGRFYLISKISSTFRGQEDKIGKIDVREVIADLYPDGSGIIFANQEKTDICTSLENSLNNAIGLLEKGFNVKQICTGHNAPDSFSSLLHENSELPLLITGIKSNIFEEKRMLISLCRNSFSSMQKELQQLYAQLDDYKNLKNKSKSI